jgi:hypothetical protein
MSPYFQVNIPFSLSNKAFGYVMRAITALIINAPISGGTVTLTRLDLTVTMSFPSSVDTHGDYLLPAAFLPLVVGVLKPRAVRLGDVTFRAITATLAHVVSSPTIATVCVIAAPVIRYVPSHLILLVHMVYPYVREANKKVGHVRRRYPLRSVG